MLVGVVGFLGMKYLRTPSPVRPASVTLAVLPFQNIGSDKDTDYLRLALPDEVATTLSYLRSVSIRPFAMTSKYTGPNLDLQQAGREMHVTDVVTGHYLKEGDRLRVTLEAVDVENNRVLWQDTVEGGAKDLVAVRSEITAKVRQGLAAELGIASNSVGSATHPKNEEAYDLYLRSVAVPHDPAPNKAAIAMLERSVGLDPTFAGAWETLGLRYYYDSVYGGGGEESFERSNAAFERALVLDPNLVTAAGQLPTNLVEKGELVKAYQDARTLVHRIPNSAQTHFTLAYVYRYAGLLEDSKRECDEALRLDPRNYALRSCALAFLYTGETARAMDFVRLDAGTEWASYILPSVLLRDGKVNEAREAVKHMPSEPIYYHQDLLQACLGLRPAPDLEQIAHQAQTAKPERDPENRYYEGSLFAYCGKTEAAYHMFKQALQGNYCSYEALRHDPLLAKLRTSREFTSLLEEAKLCQKPLLAARGQGGP